MTTPGKLTVSPDGRLTGPANITYNDPWPLKFAAAGVTGKISGVVEHTMDGTLESCIAAFNSPDAQGSAHLGIGQDGRIHQFVPFGQGYETYHAYAANPLFYGIETEDGGQPHTPISDAGLWAWAQAFECLAVFAGFPLQLLHRISGQGLGYHRQFEAWNLSGHTCPGASMTDMVRVNQRPEIIRRARLIREAAGVKLPPLPAGIYHADGHTSLAALARRQGTDAAAIWWETAAAENRGGKSAGDLQAAYLNAGNWQALMPEGMILWIP